VAERVIRSFQETHDESDFADAIEAVYKSASATSAAEIIEHTLYEAPRRRKKTVRQTKSRPLSEIQRRPRTKRPIH
jgi:hypothetical protein